MVSLVGFFFYLKKDELIKAKSFEIQFHETKRTVASVPDTTQSHLENSPLLKTMKKAQLKEKDPRIKSIKREISGIEIKNYKKIPINKNLKYQFVEGVRAIKKSDYDPSMGKILGNKGQYFIAENNFDSVGFPVVEGDHQRVGIVTGEITVKWLVRDDDLILSFGGEILEEFNDLNIVIYKVADPKKVFEISEKLKNDSQIKKIKPEIIEFIRTY